MVGVESQCLLLMMCGFSGCQLICSNGIVEMKPMHGFLLMKVLTISLMQFVYYFCLFVCFGVYRSIYWFVFTCY